MLAFTACTAALSVRARAAITFSISGTWPGTSATAYGNAATAIANDLNAYGDFGSRNIDVAYVAGVPTAQSSYQSQIQVGGSYSDSLPRRVLQHETNHNFGSGTTSNWTNKFNGSGVWTGAHMTALVAEFDGDGSVIHQSGVHFYPYGLNYDTEVTDIDSAIGAETVYMRNIALLYAQRQDDGLGNAANPWSATSVTLKASDALGTSAFNNWGVWSDNYFTHSGAAYSSGDFLLRTPLNTYGGATPNFTFAGDSLTINNTNGISGGLLFKGVGTSGILTINNLILNGGYVRHASSATDLFQLAGHVTLTNTATIDAAQGNINILAPISGSGSLTKAGSFTLTLLGSNTYTGASNITAGTLLLNNNSLASTSGVTVSSGATLSATGNVSTGGTLNASGTINLADGIVNTLNVAGGLSLSNASLNLDLGSASSDQIAAAGVASASGTNTININPVLGQSMTSGTAYTIATATGGGLSTSNFTMGSKPASLGFYQFTLSAPTSTALQVTVTGNPTPAVAYWTGQASATAGDSANKWGTGPSISKSNWSTDAAGTTDPLQLPGSMTAVIFNAANATGSGGTLTTQLDSGYVIGSLTFDVPAGPGISSTVVNTNGNALTVVGGGVTLASTSNSSAAVTGAGSVILDGSQSWANNSNTRGLTISSGINALSGPTMLTFNGTGAGGVTINGVIADGGGTLSTVFNQAGTTVISGVNTYSGTTTISSGTVQISSTGKIASDTTIASGATLMLNGGTDAIGDANAVTVQAGGTLDVRATTSGSAKTETIGSLNGGGTVTRGNSGTTTLTVGAGSFSGTLMNGAGAMALVKTGTGTLTLGGANTYTGGTTINDNGGALLVTNAGALGSGSVNIGNGNTNQDGVLQLSGSIAITSVPTINFESRNVSNSDGSADIECLSGNNSISANFNINTTGGNSVNILSDSGKLTLTGNMTSTGLSTPRGFDFYGSGDGLASGVISDGSAQPTFVQKDGAGTWTLSGNNTYTSTTTINAGTLVLSGTNVSAITIGAGAALQLQANAGNTSGGVSSVMAMQNMTLAQMGSGGSATIQLRADSAAVFNSGATAFAVNSAGSRLSGTLNFDVNNISNGSNQVLQFGSPSAVWQLGSGSTGTSTTFNVTGGNGYTLQVGSLNVGNNYAVTFNPTTANLIVAGLTNGSTGGVTKNGAGSLTVNGAITSTGALAVNAGAMTLAAGGGSSASANVTVAAGATLNAYGMLLSTATVMANGAANFGAPGSTAAATQLLSSLTVGGTGSASITPSQQAVIPKTLQSSSLTINGSSKLDLTNNILVSTGSPAAGEALIKANKVVTSTPGLVPGYGDAGSGNFKIRATLLGDSDLDGQVNVVDLANLAGNFGAATGMFWINGDFDNNASVNVADLADLAGNFGQSLSGIGAGGESSAASPFVASGSTSVPEPTVGVGVATVIGLGFARGRRRNRVPGYDRPDLVEGQ
jgi:autotransporter-associated beta strand protein